MSSMNYILLINTLMLVIIGTLADEAPSIAPSSLRGGNSRRASKAYCFDYLYSNDIFLSSVCNNELSSTQEFYWSDDGMLKFNHDDNLCLGLRQEDQPTMVICDKEDPNQRWQLSSINQLKNQGLGESKCLDIDNDGSQPPMSRYHFDDSTQGLKMKPCKITPSQKYFLAKTAHSPGSAGRISPFKLL